MKAGNRVSTSDWIPCPPGQITSPRGPPPPCTTGTFDRSSLGVWTRRKEAGAGGRRGNRVEARTEVLPMWEGCSPRAARRSSRSPDIRQWGGRSRGSRDRSPHRFSPKRLLSRCRSPLVALGSPQRLCSPRGHSPLPRRLASPPPRGFFPVRKGGTHLSEQNYLTRAEDKSIAECKYHIKGYCKFQEGCYFFHSKPIFTISQFRDKSCKQRHPKQCRYNDQCRRRTTCRFSHKPPPANDLSLLGCFSPRLGPPHGHLDPEGRHSPPIHPSSQGHRYLRHGSPQLPSPSIHLYEEGVWGPPTSQPEQSPPRPQTGEGRHIPPRSRDSSHRPRSPQRRTGRPLSAPRRLQSPPRRLLSPPRKTQLPCKTSSPYQMRHLPQNLRPLSPCTRK